jgi:NAD(P)-dependent dehydrogenase (short-subunit alcohol dehydrogenase family)
MAKAFEGRQLVVTGGTGALGAVTVARLLDEGATCHLPINHSAAPSGFALSGHERVRIAPNVDLANAQAVDAFYAAVPDIWASIHLAGAFAFASIEKSEPGAFAEMIDVNAKTAFLCCRAAARSMLASKTGGRIVNVASRPALEPRKGAGMVAYTASKAAVAAMTVALAEELKAAGILVNAVAPSMLDTSANRAAMPDADFGKWVSLDAAAEAIIHLASPTNLVASGTVVALYGRA